jgi:tRNA threonylcarbamoyladenosine biosynthesis protein TsaB
LLTLAVDTTTNRGGFALARNGRLLEEVSGDPGLTHGERLPGALCALLGRQGMTTADVDRYAVALGPGSFTGLRVGIATVQGLALAHGRPVVGIPVLDILVDVAAQRAGNGSAPDLIVPWVDAKRGEVFSALYEPDPQGAPAAGAAAGQGWRELEAPVSVPPAAAIERWGNRLRHVSAWVIGDGVAGSRPLLDARLGPASRQLDDTPLLAGAMAAMAVQEPWCGQAGTPHGLQPVYVRRPDAELARERRRRANDA